MMIRPYKHYYRACRGEQSFARIGKETFDTSFRSISFFLKSQGVIQEIYYGEHKYLLCHIEQYEELFTDIFCGKYELSSDPMEHLYKIPLCEKGQDLQKFLYDMEL